MIAKRDYYEGVVECNDTVLATLRVDEKLISVMRGAIILDMRENANYLSADMDPDEYIDAVNYIQDLVRSLKALDDALNDIIQYDQTHQEASESQPKPCEDAGEKTCRTCHLWEDGEINIACPWGSNYEHYEDDYCSLWEKQN